MHKKYSIVSGLTRLTGGKEERVKNFARRKVLLWKLWYIHKPLSQVTAESKLRICHPRAIDTHKVLAEAEAISPLQLRVTLEKCTTLLLMLWSIQHQMSGTS